MTNEEAIELLKNAPIMGVKVKDSPLPLARAIEVAIDALEKQIPKKPEESSDGYADGCAVIDYHCPNCGREIDETDHHCICGQAIDWSKENG